MADENREEEPVEKQETDVSEGEDGAKKQKDISLRSGLSKKDTAPSAPKRFTPEEIEAYLKAQQKKK
jgi:hypothetical protein